MNWGAWTWAAWASVILLACSDSSQVDGNGDEGIGAIHQSAMKGTPGAAVGDSDYCGASNSHLCGLGEGPCSESSQCASGYTCITGNLAKRGPFSGGACAPSTCSDGSKNSGESSIDCGGPCGSDCTVTCDTSNGSTSHCSTDCPCSAGEGDCDSVYECQPGLVCGNGNGAAFHLSAGTDVCWGTTCQNGVKDGSETAVDCGGTCAPCAPPTPGPVTLVSSSDTVLSIVIAPHSDQNLQNKIVAIANDLRDKLNTIKGLTGAQFSVAAATNTPSGISLGIDGDFPNTGWPYQGYFRPNDTLAGGVLRPQRLQLAEQYVLHTPQNSNRVIVAGATVDALQNAVSDLLARIGYRHYFPSPTWEVFPEPATLQQPLSLAVDEKPAVPSRTLNFPGDGWEAGFTTVSNSYFDAWRKHNRLYTSAALAPGGSYAQVVTWWQNKYGVTFPPALSTNPATSPGNRQLCLTGVANAAGEEWTVQKIVNRWASEQNAATRLSLSPTANVTWVSVPDSSGTGLNCNDVNDPTFRNISNRVAAVLNAAAEAQPTKVVVADFLYDSAEAPTIALRQNAIVNVHTTYVAPIPFALENRVRGWGSAGFEAGITDAISGSANEFPGQAQISTQSIVDRIRTFYDLGVRRYELNVNWGFGASGPAWWALSNAFWDLDTPSAVNAATYRSDFLTKAFGPAAGDMNNFYEVIEDRALWSDNLVGVMYRALKKAYEATTENTTVNQRIRLRLDDLAVYTRYLELSRKFWNRCDAQSPDSEQSQLRDLLRFTYATRDRRILESYDAIAEIVQGVPNCTGTVEPTSGPACDMPVWNPTCPSATATATCGSCSGATPPAGCNPMKTAPAPLPSEIFSYVSSGALNVPILDTAVDPTLIKDFTRDLVPYQLTPTLPKRLQSIYTRQPHYFFFQRPSSAGPLTAHVIKYSPAEILAGRLSLPSTPNIGLEYRFLSDAVPETETDWVFDSASPNTVYRLDLDDSGSRMYTTVPDGTAIAIPISAKDQPLALNYRWQGYFFVPAGTTRVVGWSQSDGTFFRNKKNAAGTAWITEPARYLSDYAVGHACTNPHDIANGGLSGLWDHFIIPIPGGAPTDELWYFNDGAIGTVGERVLLNVPPYLYQGPEGLLVPREAANPCVGVQCKICDEDNDCTNGEVCGQNNGAYFGLPRATRVCWTPTCPGACGQSGANCGTNCAGFNPCGDCATGESCVPGSGTAAGAPFADACMPSGCPTADTSKCGTPNSLCGTACICTPTCASATCANPSDGCNGTCPGKCAANQQCTRDLDCPSGYGCMAQPDGTAICLPRELCSTGSIAPPLCGSASAPCGACSVCTPSVGRVCGIDPKCNVDLGECAAGNRCDIDGHCVATTTEPPIIVHDANGNPLPVADLPAGPTSTVGAVPGSFAVTDAGTAQYSIPISVPPGRAGIQPALSLVYSGSRANGDLGMGWRLDGLSSITRCPRTYALDGYSSSVANTNDDRFCLDGKRLVAVNNGVYGAEGTEYRTVIDSFAKVKSHHDANAEGTQMDPWPGVTRLDRTLQGPDSFEVWTKDGHILTYGASVDSLVVARNGLRHAWLLTQVKDRSGNTMQVQYLNAPTSTLENFATDRATNSIRPLRIVYTGHYDTPGNREVFFEYEDREDPQLTFYQGGVPGLVAQRLKRIRTSVDHVPARNYVITYRSEPPEPSGTLSLVSSVTECSGSGICRPPTTFAYTTESGFDSTTGEGPERLGTQLDANGDGILDFQTTTVTVDGSEVSDFEQGVLIVGDVATTVLASNPGTAAVGFPAYGLWSVGKEIYTSLAHQPDVWIDLDLHLSTGDRSHLFNLVEDFPGFPCFHGTTPGLLMDYDQDGDHDYVAQCFDYPSKEDPTLPPGQCPVTPRLPIESETCQEFLLGRVDSTKWKVRVARSNRDGRFINDSSSALEFYAFGLNNDRYYGRRPFSIDVNGDALQDIIACKDLDTAMVYRRLPPPAAFEATPWLFPAPDGVCYHPMPTLTTFDVDGDAVGDLLIRGRSSWQRLRYSEPGGQPHFSWEPIIFPDVGISNTGSSVGDFNGDMFLDIFSDHDSVLWLNTGNGKFAPRTIGNRTSPGPGQERLRAFPFDYKGHGRTDLLELWHPSSNIYGSYQVQVPNSRLTDFSLEPASTLPPYPYIDYWRGIGDVDGDGNPDLMAEDKTAFGKGNTNNLLKRVEDGLGNFIEVQYDEASAYHAEPTCTQGAQWPERCLPRMHGLVSSHSEGFMSPDTHRERTYEYDYYNARMNVTGHGWLGFERRETKAFANDVLRTDTTVNFEPISRRGLADQGVGTTAPPFAYPLAGVVKKVTVDYPEVDNDLMSAAFARRTVLENTWNVQNSASARPFPVLDRRTTHEYERDPLQPIETNGTLLADTIDSFLVDNYGNTTFSAHIANRQIQSSAIEFNYSDTIYFPVDTDAWLISRPQVSRTSALRGGDGVQPRFEYDYYPSGQLWKVSRAQGPSQGVQRVDRTRVITRDDYGNPIDIRDQVIQDGAVVDERTTIIGYDSDSVFPRYTRDPLDRITQVRYDERWGLPKHVVDANGIVSSKGYDDLGRLTGTQSIAGSEAFTYYQSFAPDNFTAAGDINEQMQVITDRRARDGSFTGISEQHLDSYGRTVRAVTTAFGSVDVFQEFVYDAAGRLAGATQPHTNSSSVVPTITYSYDAWDRPTFVNHSDGTFTERRYASPVTLDPAHASWIGGLCQSDVGLSACKDIILSIDQVGHTNAVVTDYRGGVLRSIDGDSTFAQYPLWSSYKYGANSRLIETKDQAENVTSFHYDAYGRLDSTTDPDSGTTTNQYTGFDELWRETRPNGQTRTFEYNALGQPLNVKDGTVVTATWDYDVSGRLKQAVALTPSVQRINYGYDANGLVNHVNFELDGVEHTVGYTYDAAARLKQTHYPTNFGGDPVITENGYDALGTLTSVQRVRSNPAVGCSVSANCEPLWRMDEAFEGQLVAKETFGNGAVTTYEYSAQRHWLQSISTTRAGTNIQSIGYTHYNNDLVHERTEANGITTTYGYDNLNRLGSATDRHPNGDLSALLQFTYDAAGNITQNSTTQLGSYGINYQYNGAGRPGHLVDAVTTDHGSNSYQYVNGNVFERRGPDVPGGIQTNFYTPFDLPRSITTGYAGDAVTTTFEYSAFEDRTIQRGLNGDSTTYYVEGVYQRIANAIPTDTQGQIFVIYAGDRRIAEIIRTTESEELHYFHTDQLDSGHTTSTGSGGVLSQRFDPFGEPTDGTAPPSRFGFTGHHHDNDIGLIDMKGRIYDALAARFTTPDPVIQAPLSTQGLNRYSYVFNNPVNLADPTGFSAVGDVVGIGLAAAAYGIVGYGIATELGPAIANAFGGVTASSVGTGVGLGALKALPNVVASPPENGAAGIPVLEKSADQSLFNPELGALAQDAGGPATGAEGASSSGDSATRDQGTLGADVVATILPLPTPQKLRLTLRGSRLLARALIAAGHLRLPGWAAHHIVALNAKAAAPARAALAKFGIRANEAVNGVFLPASTKVANPIGAAVHSKLHTNQYYQMVNQLLGSATNRAEAEAALDYIRQALLSGGL